MVVAYVEETVALQTEGLMQLEDEAEFFLIHGENFIYRGGYS